MENVTYEERRNTRIDLLTPSSRDEQLDCTYSISEISIKIYGLRSIVGEILLEISLPPCHN